MKEPALHVCEHFYQSLQQCWDSQNTTSLVQAIKACGSNENPSKALNWRPVCWSSVCLEEMAESQQFKNFLISLTEKQREPLKHNIGYKGQPQKDHMLLLWQRKPNFHKNDALKLFFHKNAAFRNEKKMKLIT